MKHYGSVSDGHFLTILHQAEPCNQDCVGTDQTVYCVGRVTVMYERKENDSVVESATVVISSATETSNVSMLKPSKLECTLKFYFCCFCSFLTCKVFLFLILIYISRLTLILSEKCI